MMRDVVMDVEESSDNEILMDTYKKGQDGKEDEENIHEVKEELEGTARNLVSKNQSTEEHLTQRSMLQTTRHDDGGDKPKKISKYQKTQTEVKLAEHTQEYDNTLRWAGEEPFYPSMLNELAELNLLLLEKIYKTFENKGDKVLKQF